MSPEQSCYCEGELSCIMPPGLVLGRRRVAMSPSQRGLPICEVKSPGEGGGPQDDGKVLSLSAGGLFYSTGGKKNVDDGKRCGVSVASKWLDGGVGGIERCWGLH